MLSTIFFDVINMKIFVLNFPNKKFRWASNTNNIWDDGSFQMNAQNTMENRVVCRNITTNRAIIEIIFHLMIRFNRKRTKKDLRILLSYLDAHK